MVEMIELKRRIELFFSHKINVHVDTFDKKYYNGIILEIGSDFILMYERVLGKTIILFSQIENLEAYKGKEEGC